ncbi:MAG: hypothetical protein IKV03_03385 [Alphaproteobacteria bacterium]|nr:hypothetical protein [Alphaproteobacteria bacterium]
MSNHMNNNQMDDLLKDIEEKRVKRMSEISDIKNQNKMFVTRSKDWRKFKSGILMGLVASGALLGGVYGVSYICEKINQNMILSEQARVHEMIKRVDPEAKKKICQDYDRKLLSLINAFQAGERTNGYKMSPRNAVFSAHSHLLYEYGAYNPNVRDNNKTVEDWVLLDHICYRYYQYREVELSNSTKELKNPYADMLRSDLVEAPVRRVSVRHGNFFEGLKLDNVMKR